MTEGDSTAEWWTYQSASAGHRRYAKRVQEAAAEARRAPDGWDKGIANLVQDLIDLALEVALATPDVAMSKFGEHVENLLGHWGDAGNWSSASILAQVKRDALDLYEARAEVALAEKSAAISAKVDDIIIRADYFEHEDKLQRASEERAAAVDQLDQARFQLEDIRAELARVKAAGAEIDLADHFKNLAVDERRASDNYRVVAYGLVLLVVLVGFLSLARGAPLDGDLSNAVGHLIVALGLGGASAYSGRLAGQHRVTADWAESVKIQLLTFEMFLLPVTSEETRNQIYQDFSRRVLGAPPSSAGSSAEPGLLPMSHVLDLLTKSQRPQ